MRGIERFPRRPVQRVGMAIVLALILVAPFVAQNSAQAQPALLVVMNLNDSGTGSLRQAIADIASGGEIIFDVGLSGTIGLTSELVIDRNLTITGPGAAVIALSGQGETRVVRVSGAEVAIAGLTVRDGDSSSNTGGGMLNDGGSLTLTRVVVTGNESAGDGGGIGVVDVDAVGGKGGDAQGQGQEQRLDQGVDADHGILQCHVGLYGCGRCGGAVGGVVIGGVVLDGDRLGSPQAPVCRRRAHAGVGIRAVRASDFSYRATGTDPEALTRLRLGGGPAC